MSSRELGSLDNLKLADIWHSTSTSQKISSFAAGYVAYYILSAVYCLYLHPLAKYPGPLLARISLWPSYYHSFKGDRHLWFWQLQELYGPTFRYQPNSLIVNTAAAPQIIYGSKANVEKGHFYEFWHRRFGASNTWNTIDKRLHARKRRTLNSAFSDKALRTSEPFVIEHVDRWCELLVEGKKGEDGWTEVKDMGNWSDYLVFDILLDLCFGKSPRIKEPANDDLKSFPHLITEFVMFYCRLADAPFAGVWRKLKPWGVDKLVELFTPPGLKRYFDFVAKALEQRVKAEEQVQAGLVEESQVRKDMFHYIFQARDPETGEPGYAPDELLMEADLLINAGSDSTSTVFAAMFFYLTRNPSMYLKLTEEIRSTFSSAEEIVHGQKLSSCRYLRAFIDESLRMNPPFPRELNRRVLPGGLVVEDQLIPSGVDVAVATWAIQHSSDIFGDPFVFRPERWLVEEKGSNGANFALAESAFNPFSIGIRGCPGKNLAYMEMSVAMSRMLFRMDVRIPEGSGYGAGNNTLGWGRKQKGQYQVQDFFAAVRQGPAAQFKSRKA